MRPTASSILRDLEDIPCHDQRDPASGSSAILVPQAQLSQSGGAVDAVQPTAPGNSPSSCTILGLEKWLDMGLHGSGYDTNTVGFIRSMRSSV